MKAFLVRALAVMIVCVHAMQLWILGSLIWWRSHAVDSTMLMRLTYYQDFKPLKHQWVDYSEISVHMKRAVLAGEDGRFIWHHGFDWKSIELALQRNFAQEHIQAGGSTVSQQLAKNLFLFNGRSYLRKGQEAIITVMMEKLWSKQRILEVYLNSVEFGEHLFGVEAAAQYYFNCSAQQLSRDQAAFLAALLPNPSYYQQHRNDKKFKARQRFILKHMAGTPIPN
ncbi:monofunctional biosynthetic peptidoglycan transglycosylase [Acinetobacter larvae]|uniref:Biosynthetic peptidoglycan transglycosylase n=1 Tax=Acinetobacter larvae TaxID=1789224 RepID=A0A1B2M1K8_9GAMM|nr:monofunctional biosynthetic peptidoglycan transglycosylase [Acinetobacter larvae]AOA59075.1 monofunctional biosynthetic peptidoglycan transglycosylase [Acinetobacter larvae]